MKSQSGQYSILIKALLPEEVFDYFEIVKVDIQDKIIDVHLDELNQPPKEHSNEKLISKGFHEASIFQDFPIRDKAVYLHVRRRKWQIESSGQIISRQWDLSAKGSRYTKDFATFLKGLLGYLPNK
jgi:transposase